MTNENKKKIYYYVKIKDQFMSSNEITYLVNQGVLGIKAFYLLNKLILKTVNYNGKLVYILGDKELDYTPSLMAKDISGIGNAKTFEKCLLLLEESGLIKRENNFYFINNFDNFIGQETGSALDVRRTREQLARLDALMDLEALESATDLERAKASKIASNLLDIGFILNMTDPEPYEFAFNGFLGLIIEYGEEVVNQGLEYVLNFITERNPDGYITRFKFKQVSKKSQIQYLLNATNKQCEQKREIEIKSGAR